MKDEPSTATEPGIVSRRILRLACAAIDTSEATGARALAGFHVRGDVRERLVKALIDLGVDRTAIPAPLTASGTLQLGARHGVAVPTPEKR